MNDLKAFLEKEKQLLQSATPGPFIHERNDAANGDYVIIPERVNDLKIRSKCYLFMQRKDDAAFIANVRTSHSLALEIIEVWRKALDKHACHNDSIWDVDDGYPCESCDVLARAEEILNGKP